MSIEKGTFNCSVLKFEGKWPDNALALLATKNHLPPENLINSETAISGFVSGFNYDTEVTEANSVVNNYVYLSLRTAKKTIPKSLLNTLCFKANEEFIKINGEMLLTSKIKKEIKNKIIEANIARMPVIYSDIPFVVDTDKNRIYVMQISESKLDTLGIELNKALKLACTSLVTETTTPGLNLTHEQSSQFMYADFLTWLLYKNEGSNSFKIKDNYISIALGDITLEDFSENETSSSNIKTILKRGNPSGSSELKSALLSGKKISSMSISISPDFKIGEDNNVYTFKFNSDGAGFYLSSIVLPDGEEVNKPDIFSERMDFIKNIYEIISEAVSEYVLSITSEKEKTINDIIEWIQDLPVQINCIVSNYNPIGSEKITPNIV